MPLRRLLAACTSLVLLPSCLATAPPPFVSPTSTSALVTQPAHSSVLSQRVGGELTTSATFLQTQFGHSFGRTTSAQASFAWAQGWYGADQHRAPAPDEYPTAETHLLGTMGWLVAARGGMSARLTGPLYVHGGVGYGRGDQHVEYLTVDFAGAVDWHFSDNIWGGAMFGGAYTHMLDPGNPVYVQPMEDLVFKEVHRKSSGMMLMGAGIGVWVSERVGISGEGSIAVPTTTDENWGGSLFLAGSLGVHLRL